MVWYINKEGRSSQVNNKNELVGKLMVMKSGFGWVFSKVKHVTPSGQVVLENGQKIRELASSFSKKRLFEFVGKDKGGDFFEIATKQDVSISKIRKMRSQIRRVELSEHSNKLTKEIYSIMKKFGAI